MFLLLLIDTVLSQTFEHAAVYGNTESLGYYYIDIWVGTPSVKQTVILDTGSRLTAFPCSGCLDCGTHVDSYFNLSSSSTSEIVGCEEGIHCSSCKNSECGYSRMYSEGSSISGILVRDLVVLGDNLQSEAVKAVFGCHRKETQLFRTQRADGIMGLGWSSDNISSVVDLLFSSRKVSTDLFTLCLAPEDGTMTVGGYNESMHSEPVKWVQLRGSRFYAIKLNEVTVGDSSLQLDENDFHPGTSGTIIDSGTTFTYLFSKIYTAVFTSLAAFCEREGNCIGEAKKVYGEPHDCWRLSEEMNLTMFYGSFPVIDLYADDQRISWRPEFYLFAWPDSPHTYCVGVYSNGGGMNVLGGNFMRGMDVIFDRVNGLVGFAHAECSLNTERDKSRSITDIHQELSVIHFRSFPIFEVVVICCAIMAVLMTGILQVCRKRNVIDEAGEEIVQI